MSTWVRSGRRPLSLELRGRRPLSLLAALELLLGAASSEPQHKSDPASTATVVPVVFGRPARPLRAAIAPVNTARGAQLRANWSKGAISEGQARRAVRSLSGARPGSLRIVACHHPLVEMIGGPMSGRVHGGRQAAEAFSQGEVDLVLTGHVHAPFALPYPGGDGRTWAVGASTLSIRERGVPIGFNSIEVAEDCVTVTALAWTGSHFEPWRTWRIDRRPASRGAGPA
jgi:3',5'-cyclic AMP phosphodiesterase CpdA